MKKRAWKKKLRSSKGEGIAEVLIAVLISAVALALLASMITTATGMLRSSQETMDTYYGERNELAQLNTGSVTTGTVSVAANGASVPMTYGDGDTITVSYTSSTLNNKTIYAYRK